MANNYRFNTLKVRKGKTSEFTVEQELQEFKIKFADSEQQLTVWKKKYEELGFVRDGLEEELDLKNSQVLISFVTIYSHIT